MVVYFGTLGEITFTCYFIGRIAIAVVALVVLVNKKLIIIGKNMCAGGLRHSALLCTLTFRSLNRSGSLTLAQICYRKLHISQTVIRNLHRDA